MLISPPPNKAWEWANSRKKAIGEWRKVRYYTETPTIPIGVIEVSKV